MTDRDRPAVGARILALGASAAATLALMGGMAATAPDAGSAATPPATTTSTSTSTSTTVAPQEPAPSPHLTPTTAPPTTSSHAS